MASAGIRGRNTFEIKNGTQKKNKRNRSGRKPYLVPGMGFHLGKFKIGVIGIHFANLFPRRRAENFDDFDELIDAAVARKNRLTEQQLG